MSKKLKRTDVLDLVDMSPDERAMRMLELGQSLAGKKTATKKTALPKPMRSFSALAEGATGLIKRLHGDKEAVVEKVTGLSDTGRTLETVGGKVHDLVLTAKGRKKSAAAAVSKSLPVKDLAVRFLGLGMLESNPHARACAAYAYWQATGMEDAVVPVLQNAANSDDRDEQTLGRIGLARINKKHSKQFEGAASDDKTIALESVTPAAKPSMTVIIHGTFAKDSAWYQPGGDFHKYIKSKVYSDVYSGSDFYSWSGRYDITESGVMKIWRAAAVRLVAWCKNHPTKKLRLIAHSHGNNVVNLATRELGLEACSLIQLSPPVHDYNLPDMSKVGGQRLFNIRSRFDPVVAIDGGSRTYDGTAVEPFERQRIVSTFSHSDSHDKDLWKKKKVPQLVKTVCQ